MTSTIFHVTHRKAGSQWVAEILKHCSSPERVVLPKTEERHFLNDPLQPGGVYLTVYIDRVMFDTVTASFAHPHRKFVIIRDLRDSLISHYFSLRYSHKLLDAEMERTRHWLSRHTVETGLQFLIGTGNVPSLEEFIHLDNHYRSINFAQLPQSDFVAWLSHRLVRIAYIQLTWLALPLDYLLIRYEDLVTDEYRYFTDIIHYCQLDVDLKHLRNVITRNTFHAVTGRKPGQQDILIHQRKGIVGDWRNYFTSRVKDAFKQRFGEILVKTGYESNLDW
ncbi:MAG: sulfotransferase domain-containing protein [Okeania sp. SIO3B3]|nr:sulfotransferase domain-containing protein [Okeania sp. SIO3B3]